MRPNRTKEALKRGEVVVGTMISELRSPKIPQMLATAGFRFLIIDTEHGSYTSAETSELIVGCRAAGIDPIVRVADWQYFHLAQPLDWNAMGVLVPHVESREQAAEIVKACKYFPRGERGMAQRVAAGDFAQGDAGQYMREANDATMVIVQIETARGVEHVDEILSVPDIDAVFIGPTDLSASLGIPNQFDHPKFIQAYERIIDSCLAHKVAPGAHLFDLASLKKWTAKGMTFVGFLHDVTLMVDLAARELAPVNEYLAGLRR